MQLSDIISSYTRKDNFQLQKPYIIAEAGVNHEGSMELAKRLIEEAAEGGAQAIKFQTYKAGKIASKDSPSYWDTNKEPTTSQFKLFQKYDSFWKGEYEQLKLECDKVGIEFLSTPFDTESATFLNDLMTVFKISSSDLNNVPFMEFMCQFKKPILLSTGASYMWEVHKAVELIKNHNLPVCLMHCVLNYPTPDECANLGMILDLKKHFEDLPIGYSDHTLPGDMTNLIAALTMGTAIIEKHFTHDKSLPGNDHYHAMDKEDLKVFFQKSDQLFKILGVFDKAPLATEEIPRKNARRSLVANVDIKEGEVIAEKHLTFKRPAHGIDPGFYHQLIGKKATRAIEEDTVLQYYMFD